MIPHIRWMIQKDRDEVQHIEEVSFPSPWSWSDFTECLRNRNCIGMVAENHHGRILGYMIYELHSRRLHLLNLAVYPPFRKHGVGSCMVEKLIGKLGERREKLTVEIGERNLDGQLFFQALGFRATQVLRKHYEETGEDAYVMEYRLGDPIAQAASPVNRVAQYGDLR
jgi:ribosomal-protein-alanine N-acetyltransferase